MLAHSMPGLEEEWQLRMTVPVTPKLSVRNPATLLERPGGEGTSWDYMEWEGGQAILASQLSLQLTLVLAAFYPYGIGDPRETSSRTSQLNLVNPQNYER